MWQDLGYAPGMKVITNRYSLKLSNTNFFTCGDDDSYYDVCRYEMQVGGVTTLVAR